MLEQLQQAYYKAMKNVVFVDFVNKSVIKIWNISNTEDLKHG